MKKHNKALYIYFSKNRKIDFFCSGSRYGGIALIADKFKDRMSLEFLIFHNCRYLPAAVRCRDNQIRVFESQFDPDQCTTDPKCVIESFIM